MADGIFMADLLCRSNVLDSDEVVVVDLIAAAVPAPVLPTVCSRMGTVLHDI